MARRESLGNKLRKCSPSGRLGMLAETSKLSIVVAKRGVSTQETREHERGQEATNLSSWPNKA